MTVENKTSAAEKSRETHNLERILQIILVVSPLGAISLGLLAWQTKAWQLFALAIAAGLPTIVIGISFYLIRRGKAQIAAWLILATVLLDLMVGPLLFQGLGVTLGLGALVAGFFISGQILSRQQAERGIFLSIGIGAVDILLDVFGAASRPQVPSDVFQVLTVLISLVILILGFNFFRQINNYSLRIKQIMGLVSIAVISTGAVSLGINRTAQLQIEQQVYAGVNDQAHSMALVFGNEIAKQVELLNTLGLNGILIKAVQDANNSYPANPTAIQTKIIESTQQWQTAGSAKDLNNPLIQAIISGPAANELKLFRLLFVDHAEILITDRYGSLVASTSPEAKYNQADQPWWQAAYHNNRGIQYVSTPEFDEASRKYAVTMVMPILDGRGDFIGFLHTSYRISGLIQRIANVRVGNSSNANLLFPDGKLLDGGGAIRTIDPELQARLSVSQTGYQQFSLFGKERVVGQASLDSDSTEKNFIRTLNWIAVIDEDPVKVTLPLQAIAQTSLLIGLGTLLAASLLAIIAGHYMSGPITRLTKVAEAVQAGDLNARAQVESRDEIGLLAETFNSSTEQLQNSLQELEQRVAERTTELEQRSRDLADRTVALELANVRTQKRAGQLQAISDVARTIAGVRKLAEILPRITKVVSEQFGFYHTGIFLLDEAGEYAILSAANSAGGQRMLARGHRLKVGEQGIVGYVTDTGAPRIALDTGADPTYFNNPDLPETHSEMAIPLKSGEKIIGALDVQSSQSNAFSQEDLDVIQVLADQISIAIDNSRQFDRTQKSLGEAETIYRQYVRREWGRLTTEQQLHGFRYTITGASPLDERVESENMKQAAQTGEMITETLTEGSDQAALAIPIKLRDEVIGVLNVSVPGKRVWSKDEIGLIEAVAERVAVSAENARLFDESQKRAEKEQIIGEITSKIGASINLRSIMQTAVEELGHTLSGSEVSIRIKS